MRVPPQQIGIYKITSPSGKIYIGQSWNISDRIRKYKSRNGSKRQPKLQATILKYGWNNLVFEVIEFFKSDISQVQLDNAEIFYINHFKSLNFELLNIKEGGRGGKNNPESIAKMLKTRGTWNHTEEIKKQISASHKGILHSEETKVKMLNNKNGAKLVLNIETGIFYFGIPEASKAHCLNAGTLAKRFQGKLQNNTNLIQL